jgi:UDP-N-acetyl-D-mannosaminuronic acid transferase (WecB/TagA/CpsF family)
MTTDGISGTSLGSVVIDRWRWSLTTPPSNGCSTPGCPEAATVLGFVNAHAMNLVARDGAYTGAVAADVLLRDGSGMAILYRRLGLEPGLNMNGTDFIPGSGGLPWAQGRLLGHPATLSGPGGAAL